MIVYGQVASGHVNRCGGALSDDAEEIDPVREYVRPSVFEEMTEGATGKPL